MGIHEGCVLQSGFPSFLLRIGHLETSVPFRGLGLTCARLRFGCSSQCFASIGWDLGSAQHLAQYWLKALRSLTGRAVHRYFPLQLLFPSPGWVWSGWGWGAGLAQKPAAPPPGQSGGDGRRGPGAEPALWSLLRAAGAAPAASTPRHSFLQAINAAAWSGVSRALAPPAARRRNSLRRVVAGSAWASPGSRPGSAPG